ncbi:transcriptional regulator [Streptococcus uberis]|uniref:transcriptional regulator n=1 Tax=Streptococcus uberis TaxID=1349 RepID=UPI001FF177AD|nr:transcriptional regulator [Streptococcus uberis]MCK1187789.1 transcriptional regulator [Streptococcus uberis]MCK1200560.1 transcriptional regulator [Streptococcus uberis]MCK1219589.1 transcriptional regulator [Streptococcus uberis]
MNKLSNSQLKAFDEWLFDYRDIDRKIALRKLEIQTPVSTDVNVGGGKSSLVSRKTEDVVAKWSSDWQIASYERFKGSVERTLLQLDDELKEIFNLRWGIGSSNTWEEIAPKIHTSIKGVYRKREHILTLFAQQIGKL